jgi:HEAT repeat protein
MGIAHEIFAAPAWPTPPRPASRPAASASPGVQDIEQNLALVRGNNTPDARKLGATRLLDIGGSPAAKELAALLQASPADLAAQIAVCAALADSPHPTPALLDPLLELLGDPRPGLQEILAPALHQFDRAELVDRLRPIALESSQKRPRRLAAIAALGTLGEEKNAVAALAVLLDDPSRSIRAAALASFSQATGIAHPDPAAAKEWWTKHTGMSLIEWLRTVNFARSGQVRAMLGEKTELTRRLIASYREVYLQTPESARSPYLKSLLTDGLPAVRLLGLDLINDLITDRKEIDPQLKPLIAGTLVDPDHRVRMMAARIVSDLRLTVGLAKLTDAISREPVDDVRAAQVAALGRLDEHQAVPALTEKLADESTLVVAEAAIALGNLARRGRADPPTSEAIARVLIDRFEKTPKSDTELREKFLVAMGSIDAPELRPIFERELRDATDDPNRRAAISALAASGDPEVSSTIRPFLNSSDPDTRLAVVDALAKCGRPKVDLDALSDRLGNEAEPDASVRQRAWEAYLAVLQHAPPDQRLSVADSFDLPNDKIAQRRRLDILKSVRADTAAFEALSVDQRIDLLEKCARVQLQLGEFSAAAATWEQATGLCKEVDSPRYAAFSTQCVAALMKGRDDEPAARRITELTDGQPLNGELSDSKPLAVALREEIAARIASADEAVDLDQALKLATLTANFVQGVGPEFVRELDDLRARALVKRDAVIDGLLSRLAGDPDAEGKLIKDNPKAVLTRIYQKLTVAPDIASPHDDEERLIRLARRIAPEWEGYSADSSPDKKAESLNDLREKCDPLGPEARLHDAPHSKTSAPSEKKIGLHTVRNSNDL